MADNMLNFERPLLSVRRRVAPTRGGCEETKTGSFTQPPVYRSELKSGPIRIPGVVPFTWECSPGQPKQKDRPLTVSVSAPKLPPGRNVENSKEESSSDSGDSDQVYVDARDTLSTTESPEFTMDRFLPAAKAMASEMTTPQYLTRKQRVVFEEQSQRSCSKPSLQYQEKDEEEESDDGYEQPQELSSVCGLLPRFCVRSSLCVLNPQPMIKMKSRRKERGRLERLNALAKEVDYIPGVSVHIAGTKGNGSDGKGSNAFEESTVIEKTLCVDTTHQAVEVESLNLDVTDSSQGDFKTVNGDEGLLLNAHKSDAFSVFCSTGKSNEKCADSTESREKHQNYSRHDPAPPPLPKSPSDSWLCRTLPSMATKQRAYLRLHPQSQFPKAHTRDVKWETMVAATNAQHRLGSLGTISELT